MRKVLALREKYASAIKRNDTESFCKLLTGYSDVIAFMRGDEHQRTMVLFNRDLENSYDGELDISWCNPDNIAEIADELTEGKIVFKVEDNKIKYSLKAGQCCFFAW